MQLTVATNCSDFIIILFNNNIVTIVLVDK